MRTLTGAEAGHWCKTRAIELDANGRPLRPGGGPHCARFKIPSSMTRLAWFCRLVEAKLQPRDRLLLWVTDWGVWESSENWHLYYRVRQSYGDFRLLEEAPGHLFLDYEPHDLVSFLQIGLTAGWDMCLLPSGGYGRAFVSHDGWIEFAVADEKALDVLRNDIGVDEMPSRPSTPAT